MSKDIFYDKDIREPLFDFLESSFGKVRILEEKRTGSARADVNPRVKDKRKISILWRTELNHLLEKNDLPKYKEKSKLFVQEKLIEKVPGDVLWKQACEELFERDYNAIAEEIETYRKNKRKGGNR